ncbi:MAG: hypothetical protein LBO77_01290, partial [Desulfovibrio sp.]|nr:hypothetical protein [Desulfovibrio sp.]
NSFFLDLRAGPYMLYWPFPGVRQMRGYSRLPGYSVGIKRGSVQNFRTFGSGNSDKILEENPFFD